MIDETVVLMNLRNAIAEKNSQIQLVNTEIARLTAFREGYQICIDMIEREIAKSKMKQP